MSKNPIIYIPHVNPKASIRLLCLPYAGGSSAIFGGWEKNIHEDVELVLVQLPGRGSRIFDSPYQTMDEIVNSIFTALGELSEKPLLLFGHSMGARIAYELALLMCSRRTIPLPLHMVVSACAAPFVTRSGDLAHGLTDEKFIGHLRKLNGSPDEVLSNNELMELILPALRADFKIVETYCNTSRAVLPFRISVFAGRDDKIEPHHIEYWRVLSTFNVEFHWFGGGHFFINTHASAVLATLNNLINFHIKEPELEKKP